MAQQRKRPTWKADGGDEENNSDELDSRRKRAKIDDEDADIERLEKAAAAQDGKTEAADKARNGRRKAKIGEHLGTIKSVEMRDFMCHKFLTFNFGPQINFIIGHNGSGKSAVLTAITVALGGKTSSTGRAAGVKELVRQEADRAKITLTLLNGGVDAYRPDVYGDEITIERTIMREGAGTWKIRGKLHGNKEISKKRDELNNITQHMLIQIDNPLTVLTQDQSRAFLASSDPMKKYELFHRGTGLEELAQQYNETQGHITACENCVNTLHERLPELKDEKKKWEDINNSMHAIVQNKEKLENLNNNLAWAYVRDKAVQRDTAQVAFENADRKLMNITTKIKESEHSLQEATEEVDKRERAKKDFVDSQVSNEEERLRVEAERAEAVKIVRDIDGNVKDLETSINARTKEIDRYQQQREAEIAKSGNGDLDAQRRECETRIQNADEILRNVTREEILGADRRADLVKEREIAQEKLSAVDATKTDLQGQHTTLNRRIDGIRRQAGGKDTLGVYGTNIQAVKAEIAKRRWNRGPPIGPLGLHVKLKPGEDRYGKLLSHFLSGLVTAWAVQDSFDRSQLMEIFRLCMSQRGTAFDIGTNSRDAIPQIIQHSGELFDFSKGDLRNLHQTVLSKLEFSDPRVERIFINAAKVEQQFVADSRRQADELAMNLIKGRHQTSVITVDRFTVRKTAGGGLHTQQMGNYNGPTYLITDVQSELNALTAERKDIERLIEENLREKLVHSNEIARLTREIADVDARSRKIMAGKSKAQKQKTDAQAMLDEAEPADISAFTEAIQAAERVREAEIEQLAGLKVTRVEAKNEFDRANEARTALKRRKDDFQAELNQYTDAIGDALVTRTQKDNEVKHWKKSRDAQQKICDRLEEEVNTYERDLATWTKNAEGFCARREVDDTATEDILREKTATEKALKAQQHRSQYNHDDVLERLRSATRKYNKMANDINKLVDLKVQFEAALRQRRATWNRMRGDIASRTKTDFLAHLAKRGFLGAVTFDHENSTLSLKVQTESDTGPRNKDADNEQPSSMKLSKDPRALSGGETSYSTICLLMAMWESLHCPIRCLDEFDVFMDAHNRALSMNMLIENAKAKSSKQYILITPQDMTNVQLGNEVRAHRMPDPERAGASQARLEFPVVN